MATALVFGLMNMKSRLSSPLRANITKSERYWNQEEPKSRRAIEARAVFGQCVNGLNEREESYEAEVH